MPPPMTDVLPDEYEPARIDPAWLAALTDRTAWHTPSPALPTLTPFLHLETGTLADAGTAPLFDLEHASTAWFYTMRKYVSDAHLSTAAMTSEQFYSFGVSLAVLFTREKRAIAHRGRLLRLWPAHSDVAGEYTLFCPPTPPYASQPSASPMDALIVELRTTELPAVVRDMIVASARLNTTVLLARTVQKQAA